MSRAIIVDRELSRKHHNGVNSTLLIEKIIRERVFDSLYWKQYCFNINAASLMDRAIEIGCVGNQETGGRPFPFMCLLVKLIQLMPDRSIVEFYVEQERFKYLKMLGLVYIRLVYKDKGRLQKELNDYRKVRVFENGGFKLSHVDEIVDRLINDDMFIGLNLPYMKDEGESESESESDDDDDESND